MPTPKPIFLRLPDPDDYGRLQRYADERGLSLPMAARSLITLKLRELYPDEPTYDPVIPGGVESVVVDDPDFTPEPSDHDNPRRYYHRQRIENPEEGR